MSMSSSAPATASRRSTTSGSSTPRRQGVRHAGAAVSRRGDDLVEGIHHGARALRRRRHHAPAARTAPKTLDWERLVQPLRRRTGACCSPTCACSASSIRPSARRIPDWVMTALMARLRAGVAARHRRPSASARARCCRASSTERISSNGASRTRGCTHAKRDDIRMRSSHWTEAIEDSK